MKIKNICCIGAGYVGGPTMAVIALKCPNIEVNVVDINKDKISLWNSDDLSKLPVNEPGLAEIIKTTRNKNLFFSNNIDTAIKDAEIIFLAVNTPTIQEGPGKGKAADLKYIIKSAERISRVAKGKKIIVEKSTLPVKTAEKLKEVISLNSSNLDFEIVSNPEFLAEGTAINDLFKSDRVLIGGEETISGRKAVQVLSSIYENWIPKEKIIKTNIWSSELSKLVSNAMLAQRISSINSLTELCEKTGADIDEISEVVGADIRIGPRFLKASVGFGGSCFQKDILNLVYICELYNLEEAARYWHGVIKINDFQKNNFSRKLINSYNSQSKPNNVTILGWAFKKNTNDSRESAAIYIANNLLNAKIPIKIYDPLVKKDQIINDLEYLFSYQKFDEDQIKDKLKLIGVFDNANDACNNSNTIAIVTEWDEFTEIDWNSIVESNGAIDLFDGRNILSKQLFKDTSVNYYKL